MTQAFVALGSNLEAPITQVTKAVEQLAKLPKTSLVQTSSLYQTTPIDCPTMDDDAIIPDFINAVTLLETTLSPIALLEAILAIEDVAGRLRPYQNAPRVLDCDLLLHGDATIESEKLTLPHPRLHLRGFVLLPLFEIAPALILPNHGKIAALITPALSQGITKLTKPTL